MDHKEYENISSLPSRPKHNAAVIGAGPAGLAIIGKLLDAQLDSILWVDPSFSAGRLCNYPEVPSNTKVKLFLQYIEASSAFKEAIKVFKQANPRSSVFDTLENMDQEKGSSLYYAIEMVKHLTDIVLEHYKDRITQKISTVASIEGQIDSEWTLRTHDGIEFKSDLVFLATGSNPNVLEDCNDPIINRVIGSFSNDCKTISLDLSLFPTKLAETIKPEDSVAIIGSSHSAILALKNLVELPESSRPRKIYNFYRSELRYAEYMDGWILYDNTGLKGDVAVWAKANLSQNNSIKGLTRLQLDELVSNEEQYRGELKNVTASILSIGFKRNTLPRLIVNDEHIKEEQISYDGQTANLVIKRETRISTIFGYGIGFPERVVDRYGNKECAVGLWKFMEYILKTLPTVLDNYLQK